MSLSFKKFVQVVDSENDEQISELFTTSFTPQTAAKLRADREKAAAVKSGAKDDLWNRAKQKSGEEAPLTPAEKQKLKDKVWAKAKQRAQGLNRNDPEFAEESYKPLKFAGTCNKCGHKTETSTDNAPIACKWGKCSGTVDTLYKRSGVKESVKSITVDGWMVINNSFVTKGSDPTEYTKWTLTKDDETIKVEEFFGDWIVDTHRGLNQRDADHLLAGMGAPTTRAIEQAMDEQEHADYDGDPFGGQDPYYGHS